MYLPFVLGNETGRISLVRLIAARGEKEDTCQRS